MNIKTKTLFWFLLPSILIAALATSFCYFYTRNMIKQNVFQELELAADVLKEYIHVFLEGKRARTLDFSTDGFIREYTEEITRKESRREYYVSALSNHLITNKKSTDPGIVEVLIVDFSGEVIASTNEESIGIDVSSERFFTKTEFSDAFADTPHYDNHLKEFIIDYSTILLSKIGREGIGIIVNRIKYEQQKDVNQAETSFLQNIAVNKARIIDFGTDGYISDCTEEIIRREEGVQYYTNRLNTHLNKNKKPLDPDIIATFIVDLTGKIIGSSEFGLLGKDVSDQDYFSKTMKRGSCISDLHYFHELKHSTFEVARIISSKEGRKPIGIMVNRYKGDILGKITRSGMLEELGESKQLKGLGEAGEVYIVKGDKLMITGSRFVKDAVLKQVVDTVGVRDAFDNGVGVVCIYPDYRGLPTIGASRYIEEMDWVVLAEKNVSAAFAPIVRLRNFTIIMGVMGVIVIVVVAVFLSNGITRPIRKLIEGTRRIAGGNLEEPIIVGKRKDEIKELGESFNTMMRGLSKSTTENKQLFLQVKKSRDELNEKAKELEKINIELEDFIYILSHDLKEPLFSIEGFRSRLSIRYKDILDEKGKSFLKRIEVNTKVMSKKINEIMEVVKVGRVEYKFEDIDVKDLVRDIIKTLDVKIKENKIDIINQNNLPTEVFCDKARLKDVFSNLIINAIKYMGDDKALFNKGGNGGLRRIVIGCDRDGEYYKFFVEDTGIGIRKEYQDQIFKIFRRLNDVEMEGTRVGLAIVKKIVELHDGRVWVESPVNDGKGSRFCFTIPILKKVTVQPTADLPR